MLYKQDKHKNRARMGHILGYFRQYAPSRTLEAQAIINPERFGKYAKNPESLPAKAFLDAAQAVKDFGEALESIEPNAKATAILTQNPDQESNEPDPFTEAWNQTIGDFEKLAATASEQPKDPKGSIKKQRSRKPYLGEPKNQCCG